MSDPSVITVGFCPAWDITCRVSGVQWDQHALIDRQTAVPAGKALNVSRALAQLGRTSTAAGLWGQSDWAEAQAALSDLKSRVDFQFTVVPGHTRRNITVVDTLHRREMHLRAACTLASEESLGRLREDLQRLAVPGSIAVFSGSMPKGNALRDSLDVIASVRHRGVRVIVDSSGAALARAVKTGGLYAVKPNLEELGQLLGRPVADDAQAIIDAARRLCGAVEIVLVSRGKQGAVCVTRDQAIACRVSDAGDSAVNTVGCGDYLLAGFLAGGGQAGLRSRLEAAVRVAAVRAWGWIESRDVPQVMAEIDIDTTVFQTGN